VPNSIPEINITSGVFVIRDMVYSFGCFSGGIRYGCWIPLFVKFSLTLALNIFYTIFNFKIF
ncbi:hypothetical protein, partial [Vibrio parahaemolyticus]|uniref:hypothetical protein n=1 Tax=Vibrio parahaemolyticus TaxID=670 RepID=UPI001E3FF44F